MRATFKEPRGVRRMRSARGRGPLASQATRSAALSVATTASAFEEVFGAHSTSPREASANPRRRRPPARGMVRGRARGTGGRLQATTCNSTAVTRASREAGGTKKARVAGEATRTPREISTGMPNRSIEA